MIFASALTCSGSAEGRALLIIILEDPLPAGAVGVPGGCARGLRDPYLDPGGLLGL